MKNYAKSKKNEPHYFVQTHASHKSRSPWSSKREYNIFAVLGVMKKKIYIFLHKLFSLWNKYLLKCSTFLQIIYNLCQSCQATIVYRNIRIQMIIYLGITLKILFASKIPMFQHSQHTFMIHYTRERTIGHAWIDDQLPWMSRISAIKISLFANFQRAHLFEKVWMETEEFPRLGF